MRHNDFKGYIEELIAIHEEYSPIRLKLERDYQAANQAYADIKRDVNASEVDKAKALVRKEGQEEEYRTGVRRIQEGVKKKVFEVREDFEKHLSDFYKPDGKLLDEDIVRLLNSGIRLSTDEINDLFKANTHNPTMLRLLSDFCDKQGVENQMAKVYGMAAKDGGKKEMELFATIEELVNGSVSDDSHSIRTWGIENNAFETISERAKSGMDELSIKPDKA